MKLSKLNAADGQGWARGSVAIGAVLSIAGNATETVLTASPVNLAIRITLATFLPVIVFFAVEVFVRVAWRRTWLDFFGRAVLILLPSFGAAYVSFGHLFNLSRSSGADDVAASANALAIDGLMIGGTVALLAIRAARLAAQNEEAVVPLLAFAATPKAEEIVPEIVAALPVAPKVSKPRATPEYLAAAVKLLLDGRSQEDAATESGAGLSTVRRYARVIRMVREDQDVKLNLEKEKVRPELVDVIRHAIATEGTEATA